jgi:hypothetical protein
MPDKQDMVRALTGNATKLMDVGKFNVIIRQRHIRAYYSELTGTVVHVDYIPEWGTCESHRGQLGVLVRWYHYGFQTWVPLWHFGSEQVVFRFDDPDMQAMADICWGDKVRESLRLKGDEDA